MHGAISNFFPCFSLPFQCNFQGVNDVLHFCRQSCRSEHTWQGWSGSVGNTEVCLVFSIFLSIDNIRSRTCWGKNCQRWRGRLRLPKMNLMPKRSRWILLKRSRKRKWRNKTRGSFDSWRNFDEPSKLCNLRMFYYRDLLKKHLKKKELESLLEHNKQEIPVGEVKCLPSWM